MCARLMSWLTWLGMSPHVRIFQSSKVKGSYIGDSPYIFLSWGSLESRDWGKTYVLRLCWLFSQDKRNERKKKNQKFGGQRGKVTWMVGESELVWGVDSVQVESKTRRICRSVFIARLFTVSKRWQPLKHVNREAKWGIVRQQNLEKHGNSDTCYNPEEPGRYYSKWNKNSQNGK